MNKKMKAGFTLLEIIIVVVLLGIIAGFALPNYQKSIRKAHERDAIVQLSSLHATNLMYNAQDGGFLPGTLDITGINTGLGINIIANGMTYAYVAGASKPTTFSATAVWDESGTTNDFTARINEKPIDPTNATAANRNPCCFAGTCPSLLNCS